MCILSRNVFYKYLCAKRKRSVLKLESGSWFSSRTDDPNDDEGPAVHLSEFLLFDERDQVHQWSCHAPVLWGGATCIVVENTTSSGVQNSC